MVFLPASQGVNLDAFRVAEELSAALEAQRQAVKVAQQIPTEELLAAHKAMRLHDVQPVLQQMRDAVQIYQNQVSPAIEAAQEIARQQQQIKEMVSEAHSALNAVRQVTPQQWAALAGLAGISVSATAPLWTTVPGMTPSATQLPAVSLSELLLVLGGEAGHLASVAMDLAAHHAEAVLTDENHTTFAMYLIAGLVVLVLNEDPSLQDVRKMAGWMPLVVAFVKNIFLSDSDEE